MPVTDAIRSPRALTAAVLVSVAMPFGLSGCAGISAEPGARAFELRAAHDSDLLSVPADRYFALSEFEIVAPQALASLSGVAQSQLTQSGHIVLNTDVITEAEIEFEVAGLPSAAFALTEPTALRRAEGETDPIYAVGLLTVGDNAPAAATVKLTPTTLGENTVEFEIEFDLPDNLPFETGELLPHEVTARAALTADGSR